MELMEIEKTNRMNALFEFYAALLTDKQMNYIELYYADDYSLAEIAEEFVVKHQEYQWFRDLQHVHEHV